MNEEQYKSLVASLGCIVTGEPAIIHHVKCFCNGYGRGSDYLIIPLAPRLHNQQNDSIHLNRSLFEDKYGREVDLLAKTIAAVAGMLNADRIPF